MITDSAIAAWKVKQEEARALANRAHAWLTYQSDGSDVCIFIEGLILASIAQVDDNLYRLSIEERNNTQERMTE